jgi:hypothetical protein
VANPDFRDLYYLERYLFENVTPRFQQTGTLSTFDFFCIVIWKANRSKSKVAVRLLSQGHSDLESAVAKLITSISEEPNNKLRMKILIDGWGFRLPMASAILSVLYPDAFTVYDWRVCDALGAFHYAKDKMNFDLLWEDYQSFLLAVEQTTPDEYSLRDKDRWLWGKSFCHQLENDIKAKFVKTNTR